MELRSSSDRRGELLTNVLLLTHVLLLLTYRRCESFRVVDLELHAARAVVRPVVLERIRLVRGHDGHISSLERQPGEGWGWR